MDARYRTMKAVGDALARPKNVKESRVQLEAVVGVVAMLAAAYKQTGADSIEPLMQEIMEFIDNRLEELQRVN